MIAPHEGAQDSAGHDDAPLAWGALARLAGSASPDVLAVLDETATVVWVNHRSADVLGVGPRDLAGTSVLGLLHPDDVELAATVLASAASAQPELQPARYRLRHADGRWIDVEATGVTTTLPDGRGVVVVSARPYGGGVVDALAALASGRDMEAVVDEILDVFLSTREGTAIVISWFDDDGALRLHHHAGAPPVVAAAHDATRALARVDEPYHVSELDRLPPPLRHEAAAVGFAGFVTTAVADPSGHGDACITLWASDVRILEMLALGALREPAWALRLALQQRHYRARLEHAAAHDPLTGLANRSRLFDELDRHLRVDGDVTVLFLDLDGLKPINDRYGHEAGDEVLVAAAGRLRSAVRPHDLVARMGGDEFVVVCPGADAAAGEALAERLLDLVSRPIAVAAGTVGVTLSIGVASTCGASPPADRLVASADSAMYEAKRAGRAGWRVAPTTGADPAG